MHKSTERPLVVFVDVDDTLVRSFGTKRIPMDHTVRRVRALHAEGAELYCWSSGGGEYARASARELDVEACFVGFLPKPRVMIDDIQVGKWPELIQFHPNEIGERGAADLREELGERLGRPG